MSLAPCIWIVNLASSTSWWCVCACVCVQVEVELQVQRGWVRVSILYYFHTTTRTHWLTHSHNQNKLKINPRLERRQFMPIIRVDNQLPCTHSLINSLTHPLAHPITQSLTHSLTHTTLNKMPAACNRSINANPIQLAGVWNPPRVYPGHPRGLHTRVRADSTAILAVSWSERCMRVWVCVCEWVSEWVCGWVSAWVGGWVGGWLSECMYLRPC